MMNSATTLAVPEWPEEWSSRPIGLLDEHLAHPMNGAGYGLTYGGPSEPIPFDEWEREPSHPLAAEFMPSFVDAYGFKRVLPEPMSVVDTSMEMNSSVAWGAASAPHGAHEWSACAPGMYSAREESLVTSAAPAPAAHLQTLLVQISQLDLPTRQSIAQLVDREQPGIVRKHAGEWSFSVDQLSDNTVALICQEYGLDRGAAMEEDTERWSVAGTAPSRIGMELIHELNSPKRSSNFNIDAYQTRSKRPKYDDISDATSTSSASFAYGTNDEYSISSACSDHGSSPRSSASMDSAMNLGQTHQQQPHQQQLHHYHQHHSCVLSGCDETLSCPIAQNAASGNDGAPASPHLQGNVAELLTCALCRRSFPGANALAKHMRTHSEDRQFACTHPGCNKRFSHSSTLKDHMNIHLQRKPYTCKECGKGFPNGSNLNRHARIHTKSKPYVCPVCNKAFSQSSNLRVHQKIHERPAKAD